MSSKELQLVGVGSVAGVFLKELEAPIAAVLSVSAFVGKTAMPGPSYAFNKDRSQYHSAAIMRRVLTVREIGSPLVMGITDVDLFMPDTPFVFGDADRDSHGDGDRDAMRRAMPNGNSDTVRRRRQQDPRGQRREREPEHPRREPLPLHAGAVRGAG